MNKMLCHISDQPPDPDAEPEVVEIDPDTAYDTMRSDRDHEAAALLMHLGAAINHITTHASFDQHDLIALLKRARNFIDER